MRAAAISAPRTRVQPGDARTGTVIATFIPIFVLAQVLERSKGIQFDPRSSTAGLDLVKQFDGVCVAQHRA